MAPKSKRWRKHGGSSPSKSSKSMIEDLSKMNPEDTIMQHQAAKQFICPAVGSGILSGGIHSDDDDDEYDDDDDSVDDVVDLDDEDDDDDEDEDDACLHCNNRSTRIQVRCDECGAFICKNCHWCHEYQANHEIRVCNRCDAFYCRACDEMDQCEDCGEVVCGTCSTLLSCKFCGGGVCEECATACGRCGIVLCSRDAKFAVDCDTCGLSYCLVCLASGNKDPCVRCGHRPSKRMEQLVHLRLKSIYKAFKSSTAAASPSSGDANAGNGYHSYSSGSGKNNSHHHGNRINSTTGTSNNFKIRENDDPSMAAAAAAVDDLTPGALMLAAAASAAGPTSQLAAAAAASVAPGSSLAAAAHAAAGFAVQAGGTPSVGNPSQRGGNACSIPAVSAENYEAERVKAEEAAAALLAELDEEEQAVKTKKSKKKKKKERQQAKRAEQEQLKKTKDKIDDTAKEAPTKSAKAKTENAQKERSQKPSGKQQNTPGKERATDSSSHVENTTNTTNTTAASSLAPGAEKQSGGKRADEQHPAVDPLESKYEKLLEAEDVPGLEELLASIKGVPGKAMLRKNVKKALKRLRVDTGAETDEKDEVPRPTSNVATSSQDHAPATPAAQPSQLVTTSSAGALTPATPRTAELLTIISQNHNKVSSNSRLPKGHPGTPKSECIMQMAPTIVGWVIGKGGQRIRDLMEESGARIWIDQDSMGPQDPRVVYVSGQRNNVDMAVRMIKDLISKAPTDTPNSKQTPTPGAIVDSHHSHGSNAPLNVSKVPSLPGISMGAGDGTSPFQLKPRDKKKSGEHAAKRELTCDPRFVPLLIGRRGWTIKNIQDTSGARVDIDQNVTPRKITISGTDAAVEIAARMVGDVLSYPHSLLHGAADDDEIVGAVMKAFPHALDGSNDAVLEAALERSNNAAPNEAGEAKDAALLESSSSPVEAVKYHSHGSPPPSLIMPGDGKSTISATSSLSSTPEPSVSTNKGNPAQLPPASSLLPPTAYGQNPQRRPDNMIHENMSYPQPPPPLPPQSGQPLLHSGLPPPPHQDHHGMPLPPPQSNGFLENGNARGMPPQPALGGQRVAPPPDDNQLPSWLDRQPPPPPPPVPHFSHDPRHHQSQPLHQQHAFATGMPSLANPGVQGSMNHLSNPLASQQQLQPPAQPTTTVGSDMWGERPKTENFGAGLPVNFLEQSGALQQGTIGQRSGVDDLLRQAENPTPLGGPMHQTGVSVTNESRPFVTKDDARVVESLFGGSTNDPRNDSALVSGLCGLSLDPSPSANPWASSGAGFDLPTNATTTSHEQAHLQLPNTSLDASLYPSTKTDSNNGRQHSRFSWGESG